MTSRPVDGEEWFDLAWVQRRERRFGEALSSYGEALLAGLSRPEEAHLNRAAIFSEHLNDVELAEAELKVALSRNPSFTQAWLNLGSLHEDLGRIEDAGIAYQAALRTQPGNGVAVSRLAMLDLLTERPDAVAARLKRALASAPTPSDRADMLFALGNALDRQGRYADAFQALEAANWIAKSLAGRRYDPAAQEDFVDRTICHAADVVHSYEASDRHSPIFICGMFRSGSTLVEQLLARHPAVTAGGELDFIPALVAERGRIPRADTMQLSAAELAMHRAAYRRALGSFESCSGAVTDKRCDNFLYLGLIKAIFPAAKVIHTVRQPLDNILSIYFLRFGEAVTYGNDLAEAAHYYVQYRRLMVHWKTAYRLRRPPTAYRLASNPAARNSRRLPNGSST